MMKVIGRNNVSGFNKFHFLCCKGRLTIYAFPILSCAKPDCIQRVKKGFRNKNTTQFLFKVLILKYPFLLSYSLNFEIIVKWTKY